MVVRLLQGCFNLRPPAPRYLSTWDPDQVLSFAESIFSTPEKFLTEKLVTLLALATLMRVSELASINRSSIQISAIEVKFALLRARERQRQCPLTTFTLKRHTNKAVCPVECLERYLNVTSNLLNPNNGNALFLCQVRPHLPASSSTIARWIKFFLDKAGIDTARFKAHSTRSAAASKAANSGIPVQSILQAGNWSAESTFARFYRREIQNPASGSVI